MEVGRGKGGGREEEGGRGRGEGEVKFLTCTYTGYETHAPVY